MEKREKRVRRVGEDLVANDNSGVNLQPMRFN
jgi:hypothetical protein